MLIRTYTIVFLCLKNLINQFNVNFLESKFHNYFDGLIGNSILLNTSKKSVDELNCSTLPIFFVKKKNLFYLKNKHLKIFVCRRRKHIRLVSWYFSWTFKWMTYKDGENLPFCCGIRHRIITKTDTPINSKLYRYPVIHRAEVGKHIQEHNIS